MYRDQTTEYQAAASESVDPDTECIRIIMGLTETGECNALYQSFCSELLEYLVLLKRERQLEDFLVRPVCRNCTLHNKKKDSY